MKTDENVRFRTFKRVMSSSRPQALQGPKITQAVTGLIVMSLFHEKWMRANAQRVLQAVCVWVCVSHTNVLSSLSSVSNHPRLEPQGEDQVNAWTQRKNTYTQRHIKNVPCPIWIAQKVNYSRELIDFMSTKVQDAKAEWVISTRAAKKQLTQW